MKAFTVLMITHDPDIAAHASGSMIVTVSVTGKEVSPMGKAKKIIIGVVVTALVGTGYWRRTDVCTERKDQKEVLVASVSDLAGERYDSDTTLSGTVYANATQRISVEKDMIIKEIYVSKGDEVKPGDKLISFDMTLVEMELNIARLKLQKQQQDLAAAKKRLTSLQNGGPILDSDSPPQQSD